jgi:hypothetical protein
MKKILVFLSIFMISCLHNVDEIIDKSYLIIDDFYTNVESASYDSILLLFHEEITENNTKKESIISNLQLAREKFGKYKSHKFFRHSVSYSSDNLANVYLEFEVTYDKIKTVEKFILIENQKKELKIASYTLASIDSTKKH